MKTNLLYLILLFSFPVFGQVDNSLNTDTDDLQVIRELSEQGQYTAARTALWEMLKLQPDNLDYLTYISRLYAWEGIYDSAFIYLDNVLSADNTLTDAILLKADILYWQNDWPTLESYTNSALLQLPANETLLYYRALAVFQQNRREEAESMIEQFLDLFPDNARARELRQQLLITSSKPEIFVKYFYDHFDQPYTRNWHMTTVGGSIPYSRGSFSPYLNLGHLLQEGGEFIGNSALQLNIDAYLLLGDRNYLLAGYGYAIGNYMARHRAVLNVWQVLPRGWALSAGGRYFYWDQHFAFLNAGVEKYLGDFWFQLNNYIFFKDYGASLSSYLTVRKYFAHKFNYISATAGYGTSPDEPLTSIVDLQRLNTISLRLSMMRVLKGNVRFGAGIGYLYDEYNENLHRHRFEVQGGLYFKLK